MHGSHTFAAPRWRKEKLIFVTQLVQTAMQIETAIAIILMKAFFTYQDEGLDEDIPVG